MKKTLTMAFAFLSLAGAAASAHAATQQGDRAANARQSRFERADADNSGDVTFEEFAALMNKRFAKADANGDGKITVGEIAEQIRHKRAERVAARMVKRFDVNGDGTLTRAEIENRQKKIFALLDRNDDGKLVKDEMPQGKRNDNHPAKPTMKL